MTCLKGSLNEYELDLLRARSVEARYEKARRGELLVAAPIGFLKTEDQRLEKDPDRRIQEAIVLAFRKARELGSVRQTLLWFLEEGLQFPTRKGQGEVVWKRPGYSTMYRLLTNPTYGGAYAYGKSETTTRYEDGVGRRRSRRRAPTDWIALKPHAHEGYISWEEFQELQAMIAANGFGNESRRGETRPGLADGVAALSALRSQVDGATQWLRETILAIRMQAWPTRPRRTEVHRVRRARRG